MIHQWLPIVLARIMSLLQASTLRERYYTQQQRLIILETAIDDIARINAHSSQPNALISGICTRVKEDSQ